MSVNLNPTEQNLVEVAWKGLQGGSFEPELTQGALDYETAVRVQFGVLERQLAAGREIGGWKFGFAPPPLRQTLGENARVGGPLFAEGLHSSGFQLAADTPGLLLEVEVGLLVGRDLSGPGATPEQAREAVESFATCFELVGGSLPPVNLDRLTDLIAVGMGNFGVVAGPPVPPAEVSLDALSSELLIDGEATSDPKQEATVGAPFVLLADLANYLAPFGHVVRAGQRLITGARMVQLDCPAAHYEARIAGLGSAELTLV